MKGLGIAFAVLCCLLLLLVLIGMLLPKRHVVSMSATYSKSPEQLSALITGPQSWRPDVASESSETNSAGELLSLETDRRGRTIRYQVSVIQPSREFRRRITNRDLPYAGTWRYVLQPIGAKTKVTVTEEGEVYNPAFRFIARFVMGYNKSIREYLIALGQASGEEVQPQSELSR